MAEANPSGPAQQNGPETEFDLRQGILILLAWWREILGLALVSVILGTACYVLTLEYEAAADVVVLRALPSVVFDDERFTTLPEQRRQPATELLSGRDTLFGLASSGAVALTVSERLNKLAPDFDLRPVYEAAQRELKVFLPTKEDRSVKHMEALLEGYWCLEPPRLTTIRPTQPAVCPPQEAPGTADGSPSCRIWDFCHSTSI